MAVVSVLVATQDPGAALPGLVRSIDAQTLPLSEFELIVVDASTDGSAVRLQHLAARRPNVRVMHVDPATSPAGRLDAAVATATGEYLLVLDQHDRLAPRAVELLLAHARRTAADVVLGRVVHEGRSGSAVLPDDAEAVDAAVLDVSGCVALARRSMTAGGAALDPTALVAGAGTVSALGRCACALRDASIGTGAPGVASVRCTWRAGELHLDALIGDAAGSPSHAWVVVTDGRTEIALPATVGDDGRVAGVLDPQAADGGGPLPDGLWSILLRVAGTGGETTAPLPFAAAGSAVIAGRPFALRASDGTLQLDVGATRSSVAGRADLALSSVAESARGTLLTLALPDLHVDGDAALDARVLLGGFALPATLVCEQGGGRLESCVGALAGVSRLAVLVGAGDPVQTGLQLRVGGTGTMTLEAVPPPTPKVAASAPGTVPQVQRLRRSLPPLVEPAVRRLSRVPPLRAAYRLLLSR